MYKLKGGICPEWKDSTCSVLLLCSKLIRLGIPTSVLTCLISTASRILHSIV